LDDDDDPSTRRGLSARYDDVENVRLAVDERRGRRRASWVGDAWD
jgi:hypothetical protein